MAGGYCPVGAEGVVRVALKPGPLYRVRYVFALGMRCRDIGEFGGGGGIAGGAASQESGHIGPGGPGYEGAAYYRRQLMGGDGAVWVERTVGVAGEPTLSAGVGDIRMRGAGRWHIREAAIALPRSLAGRHRYGKGQ